jgi:hypothetical protein
VIFLVNVVQNHHPDVPSGTKFLLYVVPDGRGRDFAKKHPAEYSTRRDPYRHHITGMEYESLGVSHVRKESEIRLARGDMV